MAGIVHILLITQLAVLAGSFSLFNPLWDPEHGVHIQPTGISLHPSGYLVVPLHLVFDHPKLGIVYSHISNTTCRDYDLKLSEIIMEETSNLKDVLLQLFPDNPSTVLAEFCQDIPALCSTPLITPEDNKVNRRLGKKRPKRFLPFLAAGIGLAALGISSYNTISTSGLKDSIAVLENNQDKLNTYVNQLRSKYDKILRTNDDLLVKVMTTNTHIKDLVSRLHCETVRHVDYSLTRTQMQILHNKHERLFHDVFRGEITDEIFSPNDLLGIISKYGQLKNTVYKTDLSIFYKVSRIQVASFNLRDYSLGCLIHIPIIKKLDVSVTLKVLSLGWSNLEGTRSYYYPFPKSVYLLKDKSGLIHSIPITPENCEQKNEFFLCDDNIPAISSYSKCFDLMYLRTTPLDNNHTVYCEPLIKIPSIEKEVKTTRSGIIVYGSSEYIELQKLADKFIRGVRHDIQPKNWTFLSYGSFETIQLEDLYFVSPLKSPIIKHIRAPLIKFSDHGINQDVIEQDYKEFNALLDKTKLLEDQSISSVVFNRRNHPYWTVSLAILLGVVTSCLLGCFVYQRLCKASKSKTTFNDKLIKYSKGTKVSGIDG